MMPTDLVAQFFTILESGSIKTVYQPIVSLENGSVYGYEALSRIDIPNCLLDIETLFKMAAQKQKLWELEMLCRTKALQSAVCKPASAKLFINVDPNIIHDAKLKAGFTREKLLEYGLDPGDIIFEITERSAVSSMEIFTASVTHYQAQHFKIAIDDFGSGYSGLNRICACSPDFIKIDMELVRNVHQEAMKRSAISAVARFCREAGIKVIAEGIETEEELKTLIGLGVDYGQGYCLSAPAEGFFELSSEKKLLIKEAKNIKSAPFQVAVFGQVDAICQLNNTVYYLDKAIYVYNMMQQNPEIAEVCVLDEQNRVCGILTRAYLLERFSGRFGYNLSQRRTAGDLMKTDLLSVDRSTPIDEVSNRAMQRSAARVYDAIVVTDNDQYIGVVTVKDLLTAAINIQVKRAREASPLTGLPGNWEIQEVISKTILCTEPFSIIYLDLDNFKAYNDAYGFANGDRMIKILAASMRECCAAEDFLGHIGGDDFVIVVAHHQSKPLCENIIRVFGAAIQTLYTPDDWERGDIVSKNRNGFTEAFPIVTLSIAVVTNRHKSYSGLETLSREIANTKKQCKMQKGDTLVIV